MLFYLVLIPILFGVLNILISKWDTRIPVLVGQVLLLAYTFYLFFLVRSSGAIIDFMSGLPEGFAIRLYADILSSTMVLLNVLIFTVLLFFAYNKSYTTDKFLFLIFVLEGVMNSLFLSADLFNLFIMLEVSTLTVSILIMIKKEKQAIYDGMIYFFANVIGTTFMLFGIGLLYSTTGVLDIYVIANMMEYIQDPNLVLLPYALMMTTLSLKIAAVPLFSWLPKAHGTPSAPSVVSAILSGLYIKTGVYLFIRFSFMFGPVIDASNLFMVIGFITSVFGIIMAVAQTDLKMILAYSTVSQVGLIMVGINLGAQVAFFGALFHIFSHALFKSTLFLSAGQIEDQYGTRDIRQIRGLWKTMPLTAISIVLAAFGIIGAPFFNGSVSKYMMASGSDMTLYSLAMHIINIGTIIYFVRLISILFGEEAKIRNPEAHAVDKLSEYTLLFLSIAILLTGIFSPVVVEALFNYSDLTLLSTSYLEKNIFFVFEFIAGFALYQGIVRRETLLEVIKEFEITFNGIITAMASFFLFIYAYGFVFL